MIDNLALAVSHGLIALAVWRLLRRPDLDREAAAAPAPEGPGPAAPALHRKGRGVA